MDLILVKTNGKKVYVNVTVVKISETYESKFQIMIPKVTVTVIQHTLWKKCYQHIPPWKILSKQKQAELCFL